MPRYTSYPTAPHFTEAVGASTYARWLAAVSPEASLSLYLHVPFCRSLCWFCGCQTAVVNRPEPVAAYARLLVDKIAMVARAIGGKRRVARIHWGGGTPTLVGAGDMRAIMEAVHDAFEVMPDVDMAVEIDPRQFSSGLAETLAALGINRASLGVQDIDPDVQQAIGRNQPLAATVAAAEALRANGVQRLAVDLIVGLPRQTVDGVRRTVEEVDDAVSPSRVAVFSYAHVPWMKPHQRLIDDAALPDARGRLGLARAAADALTDRGLAAIGFDHFARPDDALAAAAASGRLRRNFQGYTDDAADVYANRRHGMEIQRLRDAIPLPLESRIAGPRGASR